MRRIGLLSDTHNFLDVKILNHLNDVDEIWHAGDFGTIAVSDKLSKLHLIKGVYGNVDGTDVRTVYPLHQMFMCEDVKVWITHIGGYPGRYALSIKDEIKRYQPDLFITGHSHILKIMRDPQQNALLHINPGAAGTHGFHHVRTMVKFTIDKKSIKEIDVIELGLRSDINSVNII